MSETDLPRAVRTNVYAKWGDSAFAGFQAVPDLILRKQVELKLSSVDMVVLLNVLMHWWYADNFPFARPTVIARRMGTAVRTVQRSIKDLEAKGFIQRSHDYRGYTVFDPTGLVAKLNEMAKTDVHFLARRKSSDRSST